MISNQEEDEFVAVRVQDPRLQNEGSWNSYVDYKIFLHTNSKAFTAKTSCVRRRYSEFAWLKKKLQKNAGLVPVPDLPGKSFFSFSNEDFLEKRRKGLQAFLDSVVNMTVCLSDSQLHLFLQTQLPVGHIEDCVQGHTPYSVTDAILTYASSNRGLAQAQEEDSVKEPSLTVSYESMESPAPHLPCIQPRDTFSPELLSAADPDLDPDPDPLEGLLELCDKDQHKEKSSIRVLQKNNHLEAVVEDQGPAEATFFLGDAPEADGSQQRSCRIQAAVEVHSPMGSGLEEKSGVDRLFQECSEREESDLRLGTENKTDRAAPHPDTEQEAARETVDSEAERCANSAAILDLKDSSKIKTDPHSDTVETADQVEKSQDVTIESSVSFPESLVLKESNFKEQVQESKEVLEEDVENHVIPEVHGLEQDSEEKTDTEEMVDESEDVQIEKVDLEPEKLENSAKVSHLEDGEVKEQVTGTNSDSQEEVLEVVCSENHVISEVNGLEHGAEEKDVGCQEEIRSDEEERKEPETLCVHGGEEAVKQDQDQDQDQDLVRTKDDSDDDSGSSSNESIVKVSDEEEEEEEEASLDANGYMKTEDAAARWSHVEASSRNILDLVPPVDREDDDLQLITHISDLSDSLDLNSAVTAGDLTENSDISILDM